ncbi:hypothetical protein CTI14_60035, partial [Methylobacterium radiotolerans]
AALDEAAGDEAFDCVTVDLLGHAYDGLALCRAISQRRSGQAAGAGFLAGVMGQDGHHVASVDGRRRRWPPWTRRPATRPSTA